MQVKMRSNASEDAVVDISQEASRSFAARDRNAAKTRAPRRNQNFKAAATRLSPHG